METNLPSVTSAAKRSESPSVVDRLFRVLLAMFGRQWADMWAGCDMTDVKAEWACALHGVDDEAIRMALDSMRKNGRQFPPNQAEFVALVRQFTRHGAHRLSLASPRTQAPANAFQSLREVLRKAKE